jgi:hypothetical protein
VRSHHAGKAVAIGDCQRGVAQLGRPRRQLLRMRRAFEKREIRAAVQLGIANRRLDPLLASNRGGLKRQMLGLGLLGHWLRLKNYLQISQMAQI